MSDATEGSGRLGANRDTIPAWEFFEEEGEKHSLSARVCVYRSRWLWLSRGDELCAVPGEGGVDSKGKETTATQTLICLAPCCHCSRRPGRVF